MAPIVSNSAVLAVLLSVASFGAAQKKADVEPAKPNAPAEPAGMVNISNGKDLSTWEGNPKLWSIKDGVIRGETTKQNPTKGNTFLIYKGGEVKDFELRLSVRIDHGNSGIQYRSKHYPGGSNDWIVGGYQAEVANEPGRAGFIYHERGPKGRGRICLVGQNVVIDADAKQNVAGKVGDEKAIAATYKLSDWNEYIIIAKGNRIVQYINGVQTVDLVDNDEKGRCNSGIIALQIHAGAPMWVEFKDIRLKTYDDEKKAN